MYSFKTTSKKHVRKSYCNCGMAVFKDASELRSYALKTGLGKRALQTQLIEENDLQKGHLK